MWWMRVILINLCERCEEVAPFHLCALFGVAALESYRNDLSSTIDVARSFLPYIGHHRYRPA